MKSFLIVGTSFFNKGAQSMLFVCVEEIKKRYPNSTIYFATNEKIDCSQYSFNLLPYSEEAKNVAVSTVPVIYCLFYSIKNTLRKLLKKEINDFSTLKKTIKRIDYVIDASGYNIGSKWDDATHNAYFKNIILAKKYKIPMTLLPQTFGPFEYNGKRKKMLKKIQKYLSYPKFVFSREQDGYDFLTRKLGLTNVKRSYDLVLQNKEVNLNNIFNNSSRYRGNDISVSCNSIGIVPNSQCFAHGNINSLLGLYDAIISFLNDNNIKVYIFRHSTNDLKFCKMLFERNKDNNVVLIENDFSCFEYSEFVKQFDFLICSRFHGVVHAYKNVVPCLVLGWSNKYEELCKILGQDGYYFDITTDIPYKSIIEKTSFLLENFVNEKRTIKTNLISIQKDNCFYFLDKTDKGE